MTAVPLHTHAQVGGVSGVRIMKVLSCDEALLGEFPAEDILVPADGEDLSRLRSLRGPEVTLSAPRDGRVVGSGDVVRLRDDGTLVSVLFRRGAKSNFLFATDRCNSHCLMCSQPPRDEDDSWRIDEMVRTVKLVDRSEEVLGITGGEPTLLGDGLRRVIEAAREFLPQTRLHILSNGRLFADSEVARRLAGPFAHNVTWAVPLYADVESIHDEVVGATGAFAETLQGYFELGALGADIEVRVVLHKLTIPRLPNLAEFVYRRLPFVKHVALMGLEPMGFAKSNRERLWIDPADYTDELVDAAFYLINRGIRTSIYNLPLCVLPQKLWPLARQSISGWKNVYAPECSECTVRDRCAGFFASAGPAWRNRDVRPFTTQENAA